MKNKDIMVSKAWVGEWSDGTIGWLMPQYIDERDQAPDSRQRHLARNTTQPITLYRCRITVERLKDKRGRPITRRIGGA